MFYLVVVVGGGGLFGFPVCLLACSFVYLFCGRGQQLIIPTGNMPQMSCVSFRCYL